jgi:hypothetical protein
MKVREFEDSTFEPREIELAAKDVEQVEVLTLHSPSGANAIVRKLVILVGRVPALDYLTEPVRLVIGELSPNLGDGRDQAAAA